MSILSLSYLVTIRVIVASACETLYYKRPAIELESSTRRTVSKVLRKEQGSSPMVSIVISIACLFKDIASSSSYQGVNIRPIAAVGDSIYAGGGAFEGTVKAFIPRRSRRRVAVDRLVRGLGLLRSVSLLKGKEFRSTRPLNTGTITT